MSLIAIPQLAQSDHFDKKCKPLLSAVPEVWICDVTVAGDAQRSAVEASAGYPAKRWRSAPLDGSGAADAADSCSGRPRALWASPALRLGVASAYCVGRVLFCPIREVLAQAPA